MGRVLNMVYVQQRHFQQVPCHDIYVTECTILLGELDTLPYPI